MRAPRLALAALALAASLLAEGAAAGSARFEGWAPLMILILVVGGVLMLMLGLVGEYVWRIYDEVKRKPNYVVRDLY